MSRKRSVPRNFTPTWYRSETEGAEDERAEDRELLASAANSTMARRLLHPLATEEGDMLSGDSTLIRHGEEATTFREMVAFAAMIEARPLDKLLSDLPELGRLSETKFSLASQVLRRRFRQEGKVEQEQLVTYAEEIAQAISDHELSDKVRTIFKT